MSLSRPSLFPVLLQHDAEGDAPEADSTPQPAPVTASPAFKHKPLFSEHLWTPSTVTIPQLVSRPSVTKRIVPETPSASASASASPAPPKQPSEADKRKLEEEQRTRILFQAQQHAAEQARLKKAAEDAAEAEAKRKEAEDKQARKRKKSSSSTLKELDPEAKEKRLLKLVGEVVVKALSKYKSEFDHEKFKKYAKEVSTSFWVRITGFERGIND